MSQTNIEIERMRALGMSYAEISRETGLPVGTVKSVVHRCAKKKCEECGKAVVPTKGKRAKRFCCDACRKRWHRKHPKTRGESVCPTCGKNLNEGPCACVHEERDDRWGALDALLPGEKN